ncbi:hypothetical protein PGQ11_008378 [Apiospora arundinis]|uniref:Uncharacterized protein n=1 Tax=Apiospora arundinis TaxID=335852 RepID=A0ABR2IEZ6_9PEZI
MKANQGSKALVTDSGGGLFESLRPVLFKWNEEFLRRRPLSLNGEKVSYFQAESENNSIDDEDIMSVLSRGYEVELDRWAYKMEPLQELCAGLKLSTLTSNTLDRETLVAMVFDRDYSGQMLPNSGPLTLDGLHKTLSTPRFGVVTGPRAIQADQRIIYLTDPDRHSLAVLAATAPLSHALPLFEFMADHLPSEPRFSISVPVRDEWEKVIFEVLQMMKAGQKQCQALFQKFRPDTTDDDLLLKAIEARQDKLNSVNQLHIKTRSLLITLRRRLENIVDAWQMFASKDARYLYQPDSPVNVGDDAIQTLHSIYGLFSELGCWRDELHHQVEIFEKDCMQEYEQHNRDLQTFLAGQAERTAQAQQRTAQAQQRIAQAQQAMSEDLRALTWVSFLFLPVLVAASLCSTQTGPLGVVYTTLTTFVLAGLAFDALKNWRWCSWMLRRFRGKLPVRHVVARSRDGQPILPINHPTATSATTSLVQDSMVDPAPNSNAGDRVTVDNSSSPNEMGGSTLRQRSG